MIGRLFELIIILTFVRDSELFISKHKTDIDSSRSWRLAQVKPVRLQRFMTTLELKKSVVWKYFGFINAKNGSATKTNLDMTKAININYVWNQTLTKESTHTTINVFFYTWIMIIYGNNNYFTNNTFRL